MTTSTNDWLESLINHPIFKTDGNENATVHETNNNVERFILQHHKCTMTMRDNDLFVAVGSKIRVLNLTDLKETHAKNNDPQFLFSSVPYKLLDTPEIDFNIHSLKPNSNGRLLSAMGLQALVIVCLPRQGFGDVSLGRTIDCRTLAVGKKYYQKLQLLKAEWHPLSETHTHLVVLDSNSVLRIYDMSTDIEEPEQAFDLSTTKNDKEKQQSSVPEYDAVTFALGGSSEEQSGWEPFTVHYALRNGEMYSMCPVIPFESVVHQKHLKHLISLTKANLQKKAESNRSSVSLYEEQLSWLSQLSNSIKIGKMNSFFQSVTHATQSPVKKQGPFLINRSQEKSTGVQVTDLLHVVSEPVHILALAFSNGQIHNYILTTAIMAQWETTEKKGNGLTALLYESIDVQSQHSPASHSVRLATNPFDKTIYYVYHASGVNVIDVEGWVDGLKRSMENKETKRWLEEKKRSDVRFLIDTAPLYGAFSPIIGLCWMNNSYLCHRLVAITSDHHLVCVDLHVAETGQRSSQQTLRSQLKNIAVDQQVSYESLLPLPPYEQPQRPDYLPTHTQVVVPSRLEDSQTLVINQESLELFKTFSKKIKQDSDNLHQLAIKNKERLGLQQKEFENQVKNLVKLYNTYQSAYSAEAKKGQEEYVKAIKDRHAELILRVDKQLGRILNKCDRELEVEWTDRLNVISDKINGTSGYASQVQRLQQQLEKLRVQSDKERRFNPTHMSDSQLQSVLGNLNGLTEPIERMEQKIKNLETLV